MRADEIRTLYNYDFWANGKVLEQAGLLSEEEYTAPAGLSFSSIRGTLIHTLSTEWIWRKRVEEAESPPRMISEGDLPTFQALTARWKEEEALWRDYLRAMTDQDLDRVVKYNNTKGRSFENPLWQILTHVVNHGTQFRSEAAVALTRLGRSPGDLDFIAFLRLKG